MERAILRMERLVNDLVDVSRIDASWLPLWLERCDLVHLCRQIADEQSAAAERDMRLDLTDVPAWVMADAERMGQVLTNLLSNALKYCGQDCPVGLTLRAEGERAVLAVRDEGAGIPPESLPHLFEYFYRVPGVQVQSGSGVGLGLGLFITREIVERHGGAIEVESAIGQGTTFTVLLPLAREA
jgi:signal transduction histidine kinase